MNPIDQKQPSSPVDLANALEAAVPRIAEWIEALRQVNDVLRASAETQQRMDETRRRHEHLLAEIAQARRALADVQAEKLQAKADWDADQKRWEAEHREQMQTFVAERDRLQREVDGLNARRAQAQEGLRALRAVLADVRSRLDSMSE